MAERPHERFAAKLLSGRLPHSAIVELAHGLFEANPPDRAAFGFQTALGLALPAVLGSRLDMAPRYLLTWYPTQLVPAMDAVIAFVPREDEDISAAGPDAAIVVLDAPPLTTVAGRPVASPCARSATVALDLKLGSDLVTADLGQALRGHRSLKLPGNDRPAMGGHGPAMKVHPARAVLRLERPLRASEGVHVVGAAGDPLIALALLGRISPGNVVLRSGQAWATVLAAAEGSGGPFVIDMDAAG